MGLEVASGLATLAPLLEQLDGGLGLTLALDRIQLVPCEDAGQAPIHHIDLTEAPDHDVLGLEVAVNDAAVMGERNGLHGLEQRADQAADGPLSLTLAEVADHRAQILTLHQRHGEVQAPVLVESEVVDRDDCRVIQLTGDLRLLEEARELTAVRRSF